MRGELPLPEGAAPWTPYGALNPSRGNSTGNGDGITATCAEEPKRGWERRWEHSIIIVDREGNLVDEWPHLDPMFSQLPCGRGPHQIKISPYDPEKHVWIIDDQLHMIYRFTYDGQLEMSKGELGVRGRGPNTFDRPTDIAWLPDGTYFITDGYGGTRVAKFGPNDEFIKDWGGRRRIPRIPGPNEFNTVHSIAISADQRLFVVDRGHQRMQVFDTDGNFLDIWPLRSPHWPASTTAFVVNHFIDDKGFIWAGDGQTFRFLKFDLDGNFLYSWGARRSAAGAARLLARHHDGSARQPVPRRLFLRAACRSSSRCRAPIPTRSRGRSCGPGTPGGRTDQRKSDANAARALGLARRRRCERRAAALARAPPSATTSRPRASASASATCRTAIRAAGPTACR